MEHTLARRPTFKQAFLNQYNLILLGGAALYCWALSSPWPLLLGLGAELLWLMVGAPSATFRRWVAGQALRREHAAWQGRVERLAAGLEPEVAARVRELGAGILALGSLAGDGSLEGALGATGAEKLEALLASYARMAGVHRRLTALMGSGRGGVEDELMRLGRALPDEKDATVRMSMRQAQSFGQRRLKQIQDVESTRRVLEVKMSTLEMSLQLLRSKLSSGLGADDLGADLDEMLLASRFSPEIEAEAVRTLGTGRTTSINLALDAHMR
jgi:hypothetical protein